MSVGVGGSTGTYMTTSSTSTSTSTSSGEVSGCTLPPMPISCDFAHLNADCAPYGAVCDYIFGTCSCCFIHAQASCTSDADCEAAFGASAFCNAGMCGCR
jgi:hypothetical protein